MSAEEGPKDSPQFMIAMGATKTKPKIVIETFRQETRLFVVVLVD